MLYWVHWLVVLGPIQAISPDGQIIADTKRFLEWRPDMTTADGW